MVQVRIDITVEVEEGFTPLDAAAEVLFNAGIGNAEPGEEQWLNMQGQAYRVTNWLSYTDNKVLGHHLTRKVSS